ncbi:hypothetical protein [Streptomyces sp. 7N604]|uniref:hypothetical protein n=1 Tax=Streptomyces sp. 7N604 TaxID=3457415 RepID=UPI003FCF513D
MAQWATDIAEGRPDELKAAAPDWAEFEDLARRDGRAPTKPHVQQDLSSAREPPECAAYSCGPRHSSLRPRRHLSKLQAPVRPY